MMALTACFTGFTHDGRRSARRSASFSFDNFRSGAVAADAPNHQDGAELRTRSMECHTTAQRARERGGGGGGQAPGDSFPPPLSSPAARSLCTSLGVAARDSVQSDRTDLCIWTLTCYCNFLHLLLLLLKGSGL
ncbi:uncharacterized protein [Physcomitrium patens]|uniref:uncharacterized protein n=1 Tax=Physcomitrium patens TaxID=3218 RepID=UPI003CCD8034